MKTYIVVTPFFPTPTNWRGAYCYDFVKSLRTVLHDWRVEVFVPGKGSDYEIGGITVHRFETRVLPSNIFPFLFRRYNECSFLRAIMRTGITVEDVVVCHGHTANFGVYPLVVKRRNSSCRTLLHHHDLMSFGLNNGKLRHFAPYNRFLAKQLKELHEAIDLHVFISRLCERSFRSFPDVDWLRNADYSAQAKGAKSMSPVHINESMILNNGVDISLFRPADNMEVKDKTRFIIGCVGNISEEKGQFDLLHAIRLVNKELQKKAETLHVSVRFVGSGPDLARCRTFAQENGIDATFLPEVYHERLPQFYQELDLFVLPSRLDGFGCVYTEAYACGIPFIASENAGVEELIPDGARNLWLVKPCDSVQLADRILSFIVHRPVQHLLGEIAIKKLVTDFATSMRLR